MSTSVSRHENWSEHQTTMFSSLHEKQKAGKFCDVVLQCHDSEQTFNAHSCVLSSASPILDKLLQEGMEKNLVGTMGKILVILPDDIASSCMESLINFIYSGNIDLSQSKAPVPEETSRRKSKRNASTSSSKSKSSDDNVARDDSASIDISSLYAFLKASRCLEIHTLTEHLESAVTLSEMKTSELANSGRPQRTSLSKVGNIDSSPSTSASPRNGKGRKRRQQAEKKVMETRNTRAKSPKKKSNKGEKAPTAPKVNTRTTATIQQKSTEADEYPEEESTIAQPKPEVQHTELKSNSEAMNPNTEAQQDSTPVSVSSGENLNCNSCKATFKTRTSMKRHTCQQQANEQVNRADSFPVTSRSSKKLQCPTCQKIFTSPSVYELHMKKHISEIEAALAERAKLGLGDRPNTAMKIVTEVSEDSDELPKLEKSAQSVGSTVTQSLPQASEGRPKRASTKKFQDMMKNAFGAEGSDSGTENTQTKRKKRTSNSNNLAKTTKVMMASKLPEPLSSSPIVGGNVSSVQDVRQMTYIVTNLQDYPNSEKVVSGQDVRNVSSVIPLSTVVQSVAEEYDAAEKMDVGEMITVDCKVGSSDFDDSSSVDLVEELTQETITIDQTVGVDAEAGEVIQLDETQPETLDESGQASTGQSTNSEELNMCEVCGVMVMDKKAHMKVHESQRLKCEICLQGFRFKTTLTRHMKFHTGEGQECSVCKERFFSPKEMKAHLTKHNVKKMRTECPICKKSFTNQYVMKLHERSHSGNEKYMCEICHRKFPYKTSLKTHMLLHSGERPYICSICGKCFVQKIHAREHEMQHAGIRRFECPICNRHFAHKCGMTRHITDIHQKMRPYKCETCGKCFPRKTKLIEHNRMHTGEKPYICDICGVSYKANRSLKYHKKMLHNIIVKDYEVAIWRNGPLPDEYKGAPKRFPRMRRKKETTFRFPVSSETIEAPINKDDEEKIINNIATEVDVIATEAVQQTPPESPELGASKEVPSVQYHYQLQDANPTYHPPQYATVAEASAYQTVSTLPPASTLTKVDPGSAAASGFPATGQKTFIVPLSTTVDSGIPMADQCQVVNTNPMPGVMLTYMMPPPAMERTNLAPVNIAEEPSGPTTLELSRSASVPPMSTFRRHSNHTIPQVTNNTTVTPLPGMHTFTPVQLAASQLQHSLIGFSSVPPGVPVLVPATTVMSAAHTGQVAPVPEQPEWPTAEYPTSEG